MMNVVMLIWEIGIDKLKYSISNGELNGNSNQPFDDQLNMFEPRLKPHILRLNGVPFGMSCN